LAVEPQILLLDEPFGALDARVRSELRRWLRQLHDEIHVTSVFVTHDQEEALEVADRIVVMNEGKIEQEGTPDEVYTNPANPFVFNFLGNVNLFHGRVHKGLAQLGGFELASPEHESTHDSPAVGYIRSHDLSIERQPSDDSSIESVVSDIHAVGPAVRVKLILGGKHESVEAELTRETYNSLLLKKGDKVFVTPRNVKVFVEDYQI
jgi:sulfate transport system ATP-binding protein